MTIKLNFEINIFPNLGLPMDEASVNHGSHAYYYVPLSWLRAPAMQRADAIAELVPTRTVKRTRSCTCA